MQELQDSPDQQPDYHTELQFQILPLSMTLVRLSVHATVLLRSSGRDSSWSSKFEVAIVMKVVALDTAKPVLFMMIVFIVNTSSTTLQSMCIS